MYGSVDAAIAYTDNQRGHAQTYIRSGNKDPSRIGFRGNENLGNGTQLIFTLEAGLNLDDGSAGQNGSFFNRQSFVGLSSATYGTLTTGRQYSPYWQLLSPLGPVPALTGALGAHPGDIDGFDVTVRHNNSIKYASPEWRGVSIGIMAALGEHARNQGAGKAVSAAVKYDVDHWRFGLGYQKLNNGLQQAAWDPTASSSFPNSPMNTGYLSAKAVKYTAAATQYQRGALSVGGTFSNVQYVPNAASRFAETAGFTTGAVVATWQTTTPWLLAVGLSNTAERRANHIVDSARYRQLSFQETYWLSKRTAIYVLQAVQHARGKTLATDGLTAVGAVAVIGDANTATPSSDRRQKGLMIGLRHAF